MAQWMIGEAYFHQEDYAAAAREYQRLVKRYDYATWEAAALLQEGKCRELLGQREEAARLYAEVVENYPQTPFAQRASRRLKTASTRPPVSVQ
jgi:TolA-binding protein